MGSFLKGSNSWTPEKMLVERRGSSAKAPKRFHGEGASASRKDARDAADPDGTTSETEEEDVMDKDASEDEYVAPSGSKKRKSASASSKKRAKRGGDEEDDLDGATQRLHENEAMLDEAAATSREKHGKHAKSEMGVIEEIYCENFMCHRRMRVSLVRSRRLLAPAESSSLGGDLAVDAVPNRTTGLVVSLPESTH